MPDNPAEELGMLHAVLQYLGRETPKHFWDDCYRYAGETSVKPAIAAVLNDIGGRYVNQLNQVIEFALLEATKDADQARGIGLHISGGTAQVNVANDAASIHAQQVVHEGTPEILRLVQDLIEAARGAGPDVQADVAEVAEIIQDEVKRPKPRRLTLQGAIHRLTQFAALANASKEIASVAAKLLPHLQHLLAGVAQHVS
jgi:hypothetical protein